MKIEEHERLLEVSKLGKDQVDSIAPVKTRPQPPPRTPEPPLRTAASPAPIDKELPEKDGVCLWVSVNQSVSHSHRVFRHPSSQKSDWKDEFSFFALLDPVGEFQRAVHVYSCGGSPYWRQYVSAIDRPPAGNYKHDFTFYVSTTKLLGTMKLFVHEGGSGTVVRTTISKEEQLEDWKYKGFYFYAMKSGPNKGSVNRSGTFNSDIFDNVSDDDDVSVSSFLGTDVVKQNLAEELKRSREDLVNADDTPKDEENDDDIEEVEDEEESKEKEEEDENFGGTSSGSLLISTLPEKGEFFPFPNNPLAVAQYNHKMDMLMEQRKEIYDILEDNLESRGLSADETKLPTSAFQKKMKNHDKEKLTFESSYAGFNKKRKKIVNELEEFCEMVFKKKKTKTGLNKAFAVVKSAVKFKQQGKENRRPLPTLTNQDRPPVPSPRSDVVKSTSNDQQHVLQGNQEEDSNEDEEEEEELEEDEDNDDGIEDDDFEVSDSSEWDSGDNEKLRRETGGADMVTSSNAYAQQEEPYRPKMRAPQGEKVKELTASLEASLTLRDPNKKKLAGAVDLHNVDEGDGESKPKRTVSFRDTNRDNEDDESDFSLEETNYPASITKRDQLRDSYEGEDEDDIDNLLASYEPSSKTPNGRRQPSAASTPYESKPSSSGGSKTVVTDFVLDDFDDDDSF